MQAGGGGGTLKSTFPIKFQICGTRHPRVKGTKMNEPVHSAVHFCGTRFFASCTLQGAITTGRGTPTPTPRTQHDCRTPRDNSPAAQQGQQPFPCGACGAPAARRKRSHLLGPDASALLMPQEEALDIANVVLTSVFTVELLLKLCALGSQFHHDPFNILDAFIVATSLLEFLFTGRGALTVFRSLRLLRVLKMINSFSTLRSCPMHWKQRDPGSEGLGDGFRRLPKRWGQLQMPFGRGRSGRDLLRRPRPILKSKIYPTPPPPVSSCTQAFDHHNTTHANPIQF